MVRLKEIVELKKRYKVRAGHVCDEPGRFGHECIIR